MTGDPFEALATYRPLAPEGTPVRYEWRGVMHHGTYLRPYRASEAWRDEHVVRLLSGEGVAVSAAHLEIIPDLT